MARWCAAAGATLIGLEVALVKVPLVKTSVMFVATLCDRLVNATTPLTVVAVNVPCRGPLPAPRATVTTLPLSVLRKLPNVCSTLTCGCCAHTTPAVDVLEGCTSLVSLLAAAGFTVTLLEVAPVRPVLATLIVMVSALVQER